MDNSLVPVLWHFAKFQWELVLILVVMDNSLVLINLATSEEFDLS